VVTPPRVVVAGVATRVALTAPIVSVAVAVRPLTAPVAVKVWVPTVAVYGIVTGVPGNAPCASAWTTASGVATPSNVTVMTSLATHPVPPRTVVPPRVVDAGVAVSVALAVATVTAAVALRWLAAPVATILCAPGPETAGTVKLVAGTWPATVAWTRTE